MRQRRRTVPALVLAVVAMAAGAWFGAAPWTSGAPALAQDGGHLECPADAPEAPDDGFESGGLGLTCEEFQDLYGLGQAGQGSVFYEIDGNEFGVGTDVTIHTVRDGLVLPLSARPDEAGLPLEEANLLVNALLPADAEPVGDFDLGNVLQAGQRARLYRSESLDERYEELEQSLSGDILVVYTFSFEGMEQTGVHRLELYPAAQRG